MAKGFKHGAGGGAALNFKVVGNPKPAAPAENTIWVNTDMKITGWIFSATEPTSAVIGQVWFASGSASQVSFSATKKNPIMVYPATAYQYDGTQWVTKETEIYQSAEWHMWRYEIVKSGTVIVPLTIKKGTGDFTVNGNTVTFDNGTKNGGYFWEVDLTGYKTLRINCSSTAPYTHPHTVVGVFDAALNAVVSSTYSDNFTHNKDQDVSALSGTYFIGSKVISGNGSNSSTLKYTDVYLE